MDTKEFSDEVVTFESEAEMLKKARHVKVGCNLVGYLVFINGNWEFQQKSGTYTIDTLLSITEKLEELNGCFNANRLKERLEQIICIT